MLNEATRKPEKGAWVRLAILVIIVFAVFTLSACKRITMNTNGYDPSDERYNAKAGTSPQPTHSPTGENQSSESTTQDDHFALSDLPNFTPPVGTLEDLEAAPPARVAEMGVTVRHIRGDADAPGYDIVLLVIAVSPNGAGNAAGIAVGDLILTINGEPAASPLPQFADLIIGMEVYLSPIPGADIVFRLLRDGVELETTAHIL